MRSQARICFFFRQIAHQKMLHFSPTFQNMVKFAGFTAFFPCDFKTPIFYIIWSIPVWYLGNLMRKGCYIWKRSPHFIAYDNATLEMKVIRCALAIALLSLTPVEAVKKCEKIDSCRCSTDAGEINLWSLAGQTPKQARYVTSTVTQGLYNHIR